MSGYRSMGRPNSATPPTIIVMIAITLAKIGRSMKNLENIEGARGSSGTGGIRGGDPLPRRLVDLRRDLQLRAGPEKALDNDPVLGTDLPLDDSHVVEQGPGLDRAVFDDVVLVDDEEVLAGLVGPQGALGDDQGPFPQAGRHANADEQARQ